MQIKRSNDWLKSKRKGWTFFLLGYFNFLIINQEMSYKLNYDS